MGGDADAVSGSVDEVLPVAGFGDDSSGNPINFLAVERSRAATRPSAEYRLASTRLVAAGALFGGRATFSRGPVMGRRCRVRDDAQLSGQQESHNEADETYRCEGDHGQAV
jgi:hypothetical protein